MYTISVQNPTGEYSIHNPYDETMKVIDPVLSLELNHSGTLTFTISPDNPNRAQIIPLASEIVVRRNDAIYWIGRPIEIEQNFDMLDVVTCEGVLGYLLDTQIPPFDFTGSNSIKGADCVAQFLTRLISRHNKGLSTSWVDQRKKLALGTVTITDSNNNLARSSEDYHSVLELINEKLLEPYGGYIRIRYSGNTRYIDYINSFGASSQPISFGENLIDLTSHVRTEEIATNIIPLGAVKDGTDERLSLIGYSPTTADSNRINTLTHGGGLRSVIASESFKSLREIYDKAGENAHGRIDVTVTWDDVTIQRNLALKAAEYIGAVSVLGKTIDVSAVDLAQIDVDYNSFNLGEMATVVSIPHGINAPYQITQMSIDLYNPANSTLTLGGEAKTFTADNTKKIAEVVAQTGEQISGAIANATSLITGGLGGYVVLKPNAQGQTEEILIMDSPDKDTAVNVIRMNKNGIGFSKTGYNGPFYSAWTIGGAFNASYITTGTLSANRIKAGVLSDTAGNTSLNMTTGVLTMKKGSINLGSGKFVVTDAGALTANNVNIGGFKLTDSVDGSYALHHDRGVYRTWIRGAVDGAKTWVLSAQKKVGANYEGAFVVNADGSMRCNPNLGGRELLVDTTYALLQYSVTRGLYLSSGSALLKYSNTRYLDMGASVTLQYSDARYITMTSSNLWIESSDTRLGNLPASSRYGNVYRDSGGRLYSANEGSSSRTIKHDIKAVENDELNPERLYDLDVVQFKYNDGLFEDGDPAYGKDHIGFIIEDMAEIYPNAVDVEDDDAKYWTWSPHKMIPPMVQLIKDQKEEIDDLKARVEKLEQLILKGEQHG